MEDQKMLSHSSEYNTHNISSQFKFKLYLQHRIQRPQKDTESTGEDFFYYYFFLEKEAYTSILDR